MSSTISEKNTVPRGPLPQAMYSWFSGGVVPSQWQCFCSSFVGSFCRFWHFRPQNSPLPPELCFWHSVYCTPVVSVTPLRQILLLLIAFEQTHCARLWFYMSEYLFIARLFFFLFFFSFIFLFLFEYPPKWCTYSAGMAGATCNCCHLGAFCVHHVTSCKATYIRCMRV